MPEGPRYNGAKNAEKRRKQETMNKTGPKLKKLLTVLLGLTLMAGMIPVISCDTRSS